MVQIKKKVTIKQKTEQSESVNVDNLKVSELTNSVAQQQSTKNGKENKSFIVIGVIACLLCLFGLIYILNGKDKAPQNADVVAETVHDTPKESPTQTENSLKEESVDIQGNETPQKVNSVVEVSEKPVAEPVKELTTTEQTANRVIQGEFGNGKVRKRKLGKSYSEVQKKVNEMYRKGLVH